MSQRFGVYGPAHPRLERLGEVTVPVFRALSRLAGFHRPDGTLARERAAAMRAELRRGGVVHLLGIGPGGHNAGAALVAVSEARGVEVLHNNEEERFSGRKHHAEYPALAVEQVRAQLRRRGLAPRDLHACLATFDYARMTSLDFALGDAPHSLTHLLHPPGERHLTHMLEAMFLAPRRLGEQLGLGGALPVIGQRHHDNHAWHAYAASPFGRSERPTAVAVLDGFGDDGAISLYAGRAGRLELLYENGSKFDSLGLLYGFLSSTQGGWTVLSSEGRYMGAAAWGNGDRLTNPYYKQLRQLVFFAPDGAVHLNRAFAGWARHGWASPYAQPLTDILGPPVPLEQMWNPDAVLDVERIQHAEVTRDRVDKAAATQLLFEDVVFHVVEHLLRATGASQLVLAGGCALNCVANMRLLQHLDEAWFERYLGRRNERLHLWVPPAPGDAGVTMGAPVHFALAAGARVGEPMQHAFLCGDAPTAAEIEAAFAEEGQVGYLELGEATRADDRERLADLLAFILSRNGVVGLVQGAGETGPRALGHRSILANPTNPDTRRVLNALVKFREAVRPLAPMATLKAARRLFELSEGGSDGGFNAYRYMTLTVPARPEARRLVPAVVHQDGTARVQVVQREVDPLCHAILQAMGRRVGVEVAVNTSLNVGGPMAQTPRQALGALKRSRGMDGVFFVSAEGRAYVAWHDVVAAPKDGGQRLRRWIREWEAERTPGLASA